MTLDDIKAAVDADVWDTQGVFPIGVIVARPLFTGIYIHHTERVDRVELIEQAIGFDVEYQSHFTTPINWMRR